MTGPALILLLFIKKISLLSSSLFCVKYAKMSETDRQLPIISSWRCLYPSLEKCAYNIYQMLKAGSQDLYCPSPGFLLIIQE